MWRPNCKPYDARLMRCYHPLLLADLPNYPARIADGYVVGWDIPHDNAPGSNHAVVANRHARTDDAMPSKPDIVPDVH